MWPSWSREDYDILIVGETPDGKALTTVVAQGGSCDEINVRGRLPREGIFAQFGVGILPPPGADPTAGNFYQIMFATNHPLLAVRLKRLGVNAAFTPRMDYEITNITDDGEAELRLGAPRPFDFAWELGGPITLPNPDDAPAPGLFNYWTQTSTGGNILQENVVSGIRFGTGEEVRLEAIGCTIESIVGPEPFAFPFFSAPEVFDITNLTVTPNAF